MVNFVSKNAKKRKIRNVAAILQQNYHKIFGAKLRQRSTSGNIHLKNKWQ
jgi:hypothetical protein